TVTSPAGVLQALDQREFDVALIDLNYTRDTTSGGEGLDLITEIQGVDSTVPIVVMTAWGSITGAVEAMRRGARDYIEKPWDNNRLVATLRTQIELGRALRNTQRLESENSMLRRRGLPEFIARSKTMQPLLRLMERVGPSDANVLITGEHGTGKEVVANWLHAVSPRAHKSLIAVNAGGLSEGIFESEMFGHVKGAFTDARTDRVGYFELADGGTLFLDEIGNLTPNQQAKLLRVLQTGELQRVGSSRTRRVNVRVLAATNTDLGKAVEAGDFREDLLYRLNTVELHLPPLRERREDIPALASAFLQRQAKRYEKAITGFESEALTAMLDHPWPGNVRELEHVVERAVLMAHAEKIQPEDLGLRAPRSGAALLEGMTLDDAERYLIQRALERYSGNVSRAADALGLSRSAMYRRLQQHGIEA
ncbi:MAG TPA: sigma-54 dependent transcriptional regulator, partial [Longimicrobiales bacterium]